MNTIGENRVRIDFNVDNNDQVTLIKKKTAKLINFCEEMVVGHNEKGEAYNCDSEKRRLISLAQTAYEEAAMWAVKAATF